MENQRQQGQPLISNLRKAKDTNLLQRGKQPKDQDAYTEKQILQMKRS